MGVLNRRKKYCESGCGNEIPLNHHFCHGHNQKGKTNKHCPRIITPPQLCGCGCGKMTNPGCKFIKGHSRRGTGKTKSPPHLCWCNECGLMTNPGCNFISGHNPSWNKGQQGLQVAWNKGLTKETDERVEKYSASKRGKKRPDMTGENNPGFKKGELHPMYGQPAWNNGLTKENNVSMKKNSDSHLGKPVWNQGVTGYSTKPCSPEQKQILSIQKLGEKNPMYGKRGELSATWKGGITYLPYSKEWTKKLKKEIKERDNHTCQICNANKKEIKGSFAVHHIDYDKENCNPDNLITLCRPCHGKTSSHRKEWEAILTQKSQIGTS